MTYSKQTRKAALTPSRIRSTLSRLGKDVTIKKFDGAIKSTEERETIDKLQKEREEYIRNFIAHSGIRNKLWV
jgi:hypothetical protein